MVIMGMREKVRVLEYLSDFLPPDSYGVKALASVYVGPGEDKWLNGLSCVSMA